MNLINMKIKLVFGLLTFFGFFFFGSGSVSACSCNGRDTPCVEYKEADLLFVGTVSKITIVKDADGSLDYKAKFSIEEAFKGTKLTHISVQTSTQGTACGYDFEEGERYLVYGYLDEKTKIFQTSICTRTRPLQVAKIDNEVEILRSLAKGKLEPRIYGTVWEIVRGIGIHNIEYWTDKERKPMSGIKVIASAGEKVYESVSDVGGNFSIKNLEKGRYKITFILPSTHKLGGDYWDEATRANRDWYNNPEIEIAEDDCPDGLRIETRIDGRVKGRVFDNKGKPLGKDIRVSLITESSAKNEVGDIDSIPAYTNDAGYFEFYGIPPGRYYLGLNLDFKPNKDFPYPKTYFPNASDITKATIIVLQTAEKRDGLSLYLPMEVPEIELKGKVVDTKGKPIKGAIVERYGLYYGTLKESDDYGMRYIKQPVFEGRIVTDSKGEFVLKLLKGNKYRINSYLEEENSNENLLESEDLDIEITENIKPVTLILKKPK